MNNNNNKYWDGNSSEDIADDISEIYERVTGKSSVYWSPMESAIPLGKDTLADRPEVYSTEGFTCEYECWGLSMCNLAVIDGMQTRDSVIGWIKDHCQRKVYAYFVEDHDGCYDMAVSAEEKVLYGYWQVDDVYANLDDARERMRKDFLAYIESLKTTYGKDENLAERMRWSESTYNGRHTWECIDLWDPRGWKIVEQEVK